MSVPIGGGTPVTLASGGYRLAGIALDATTVYWTSADTHSVCGPDGAVMKVLLGGGTLTTIASGQDASSLAVDATSVYWPNGRGPDGTVVKFTPK